MAGKFLKFKPILNISEARDLLAELVGATPTEDDIRALIANGYLTPIYGYGQLLLGLNIESFHEGTETSILAVSNIGVVSPYGAGDGVCYGPVAETADGQRLVFFGVGDDYDPFAERIEANQLATVDMDDECASFLTDEIFTIANMAASNASPTPPERKLELRIGFDIENGLPFLPHREVAHLHGFNTPNGMFSSRPKPVAVDHQKLAKQTVQPSHLLAIAGLLELLLDNSRPRYQQGTAAEAIEAKGWRAASASGLTKLFAKARATAAEADKVAQAKAEAREAASNKAK